MAELVVRYFAAAAEASGVEEERVDAAAAPTVGALRALLAERYGPAMGRILEIGSLLVDGRVTRDPAVAVREHADVLPPFAGG